MCGCKLTEGSNPSLSASWVLRDRFCVILRSQMVSEKPPFGDRIRSVVTGQSHSRRDDSSRMSWKVQPPENEPLAVFLARRWGAPITITRQIADGSKGNVRAALADLEMWMG